MEVMPFTEEKAIFAKVHDISDYRRLDKEQREEYDDALKRYRDYHLSLETVRDEGVQEGIVKGIEKGIEKGIKRGEQKKAVEIAVALKANGLDVGFIMSVTGLSLNEIERL